MRGPAPALTITGLLVACGGAEPGVGSFGVGSGPGVLPGSTGEGSSTTSTGAGSSTGAVPEDSSAGETGASSSGGILRDVGGADFGSPEPAGCKGKIDFLFVISGYSLMKEIQDRLIAAFPQFIATIESKFADFDYHIMVIDGDDVWGIEVCNDNCTDCVVEGYPCGEMDQVTACDATMGAGQRFPAGKGASNMPCDIAGGRRYMTHEQPDLAGTFACVAQIGVGGMDFMGEAMTAALSPELAGPGGCNEGFLRDDALLMVTFIYTSFDTISEGKPKLWAEAALAAKHGDPNAVVMFSIARPDCDPQDRVCDLVKYYFPHWHIAHALDDDYAPAFEIATDKVSEACSEFIPQ